MSPSPQLAPPGSSSYSSDNLHVGDGTWDASRDTFLLPNLETLPFAEMRYNGMSNRFRALPQYHVLIKGHGVLAAITFLGLVPAAVMIARFYRPNPRMAMRMHIWMQILTLFLVTIIFMLGWFAVGPERSLTNPHHDVGLTIYVLVWFQFLWGWLVYRTEKGKQRYKTPIRLMLHQWIGRATVLLALAQIGTGLTLFGSPKALFVLYALALALLILIYFFLSYRYQVRGPIEDGSYFSESVVSERHERRRHGGLKALAGLTAGAVGIQALRNHRRKSKEKARVDAVVSHHSHHSSHPSESFVEEEKFSEHSAHEHTWRNRVLGVAAAGGTFAAIRGFMNRRKDRDDRVSEAGSYEHPLGGATTVTEDDVHRVQAGHAPDSPAASRIHRPGTAAVVTAAGAGSPLRRPRPRRSRESVSSYTSVNDGQEHGHSFGVVEGVTALGVAGFAKHLWSRQRRKREDQRVDEVRRQDRIQEEIARRNSRKHRYTGDGSPSVRRHGSRPTAGGSVVTSNESVIIGSNPAISRPHLSRPGATPGPSTAPPVTNLHPPVANIPLPPGHPASVPLPPPPPIPEHVIHESSGSEAYTSAGGGHHRRHRLRDEAAAAAAVAAAAGRSHSQESANTAPVSVKVKMHNDGRHVTLRRLNEAEAAAEREARRREQRRRHGSLSSVEGNTTGDERWRRAEALEAAQAAQDAAGGPSVPLHQHNIPPPGAPIAMPMPPGPPPAGIASTQAYTQVLDLPPPPPIPESGMGGSGVGGMSPPSTGPYGTETDVSNYESNRRRRRAERMKAKAAQGSGSGRVEFQ